MKKSYILLIHLFYWIPPLFQVYVILGIVSNIKTSYPLSTIAIVIAQMVAFYLFYFLLFSLLSKRKFHAFICYGLISILLASVIGCFSHYVMLKLLNVPMNNLKPDLRDLSYMAVLAMKALYSGVAACCVKGCITWYAEIRYKQKLEKKNLETELALLKAQLNPHFLFNTLNNIDILIEKDPQKASIYLKKLSDMIRFMLYKSPSETIPLAMEIKYIEQYIELQRIRTLTPDFITFKTNAEHSNLQIAPMLFIPFIENAFKHTTNKKNSNAIAIEILVNKDQISFNCTNITEGCATISEEHSGLGLELIKSRLELLYKGSYKLSIDQGNGRFSIDLALNLNEYELHYS